MKDKIDIYLTEKGIEAAIKFEENLQVRGNGRSFKRKEPI